MKKRLAAILMLILVPVLVLSGCSKGKNQEIDKLKNEITSLQDKNKSLENKVTELTKESENLNSKLKEYESSGTAGGEAGSNSDNVYPIYTANSDTYKREVLVTTYVPNNYTLKQKLDAIAKTLSEVKFKGLPIEVTGIKDVNGKKVAIINLKESKENQGVTDPSKFKGSSWSVNYFQGSTGGTITSTSLLETFLQKDYKGQWVDGVQFLYNNKALSFEHVEGLGEINYR